MSAQERVILCRRVFEVQERVLIAQEKVIELQGGVVAAQER